MTTNFSFLSKHKLHVSSSMVLIVCTVLALLCANLPVVKDWYFSLWLHDVSVSIGNFNLFSHGGHPMSTVEVINDFLMAIFFLSVGLEIKREIRVGELSTREKALLPIIGACGGMIVPVLLFWLTCPADAAMQRGLAIPMATDIAFSLGVLSVFSKRVPIGLKVFLAALAVADDLGGIIVIALFYSSDINFLFLGLTAACVAVMVLANIFKVRRKAFYVTFGLVLWYLMLNSGIHATIAGVIVAFCIPATLVKGTGHYLERIRSHMSKFPVIDVDEQHNAVVLTNEQIHTLKSIESAADKMISPLQDLEDNLHFPINYIVIPLFAFANAGIDLSQMSISGLFSGVGIAVMLGLGRSLYAKIGKNAPRALFYGAIGTTVCYFAAAVSPFPIIGLLGCALTGFTASMLWPGSLIISSERFPDGGVVMYAVMAAGGDLGASVGPWAVGLAADACIASPLAQKIAESLSLTSEQLGMKLGLLIGMLFPLFAIFVFAHFWRKKSKSPETYYNVK